MIIFSFCFVFCLLITKASFLEILSKQKYAVLPKESKYNISCISNDASIKPSDLQWIDNFNKVVIYNHVANLSTVYWEVENGRNTLKFLNIRLEDNGTYVCKHHQSSTSFDIMFYEPISFLSAKNQYLQLNSELPQVVCSWHAFPVATPQWTFNGLPIQSDLKYLVRSTGLFVKDVRESDSGLYRCTATIAGIYNHSKSLDIHVAVEEAPKIVGFNEEMEGMEGTDLSISCEVTGTCPCQYHFWQGGQELVNSLRVTVDGGRGFLFFSPLLRTDQGNFMCVVANNVGNDSAVKPLNVIVAPKVLSFEEVTCEEGEGCGMECKVEGRPKARVNITRGFNNTRVEASETRPNIHSFWIEEVSAEDAGTYSCSVISKVGRHAVKADLVVQYAPRAVPNQMHTLYTWKLQTRNLSCEVDASPKPNFTWISWDRDVANDQPNHDVFTIFDTLQTGPSTYRSVLQLYMHVTKYKYQFNDIMCIAHNQLGNHSTKIEVKRATIPNSAHINGLQAYPQELWVNLSLPTFDGFDPVLGYIVKIFKNKKKEGIYNFTLNDVVRVTNLVPQTKYDFRYYAFNSVGVGVPMQESVITTAPCKPFPLIIISSNLSHTANSYNLQWQTPIGVGSVITLYSVKSRKVDSSTDLMVPLEKWQSFQLSGAGHLEAPLFSLDASSCYQVVLTAHNVLGVSDAHDDFYFKTLPSMKEFKGNTGYSISKEEKLADTQASKGASGGIGVFFLVLLVLVVFFALVDGSCYYLKGRSLTLSLCSHIKASRKPIFSEDMMDSKATPHSNSNPLLKPQQESANNNYSANPIKCLRLEAERQTEPNPLITSSTTSNSTLKSETC